MKLNLFKRLSMSPMSPMSPMKRMKNTYIFDLRPKNMTLNKIPNSRNVSVEEFTKEFEMKKYERSDTFLLYCQDGNNCHKATKFLYERGYINVKILHDGFNGYLRGKNVWQEIMSE